jgi:glycerol-3-phosphate acyltransferase PlsX
MGGDFAPRVPVAGAIEAVRNLDVEVLLLGPEAVLRRELADRTHRRSTSSQAPAGITIVDAPQIISMSDHAVAAVRAKRQSSIVRGVGLVAQGEADAFVTAGNTGAAMAAAVFGLKRLAGIERPALAVPFPTARGVCLLLDAGANSDARPEHLVQFAIMGSVYAERVLGIAAPRVALLSVGEEDSKGSLAVQEANRQLREVPLRFTGNVEGKDVPDGAADVVVTDGFVGNVMIKFAEGVGGAVMRIIRSEVEASWWSRLLALGLRPVFRTVRQRMDYAEWGGAPLLGVSGVCVIGHGRSNARAIRNAVRVAADAVEQDLIGRIRDGLAAGPHLAPPELETESRAVVTPAGDG